MIATIEDALLLFGRWKDERALVRVKLISQRLVFEATGAVVEFTPQTIQMNGNTWQFTLPVEGARFMFSDPREIPSEAVRTAELAKYEFGLAMELPSGDRLVLLELKSGSGESEADGDR
ncbi:MAG: hypothetical protein ABI824_02665 [Acidobacteriota bacterium]